MYISFVFQVESRLLQVQDNGSSQISIITSLVFAIDSTDPELVLLGLDGIKSLQKITKNAEKNIENRKNRKKNVNFLVRTPVHY